MRAFRRPAIDILSALILLIGIAAPLWLGGCRAPAIAPATQAVAPGEMDGVEDLSDEQVATLRSLEQVDDYPLYTMRYHGPYARRVDAGEGTAAARAPSPSSPQWACSLFAALADRDRLLYGRGFDWQYSPAVLLFTDPPDGYASVSMVVISHWFGETEARELTDVPLARRRALLNLPLYPYDGMNERGLVVGMAAVPGSEMPRDTNRETIGSLVVIREMLDHAADVDQAIALMDNRNITWRGGPPLHYLIADASGRSALVEFHEGERVILPNESPWHLATNHLRAIAGGTASSGCWRYDMISRRLRESGGRLAAGQAMDLLQDVSVPTTQWSIVYGMSTGDVRVVMGRQYEDVHTFHQPLARE
jgi:hypothetical protein